jgi:hypothetical protein
VIEGVPGEGWYEVHKSKFDHSWECQMIRLCTNNKMDLAALIFTDTFEQTKEVAERHWETGVWAEPKSPVP